MGVFGLRILQSDIDIDWAQSISAETGLELLYPPNPSAIAKKLNAGLLTTTFERYLSEDQIQYYGIVILGILAMALGAKIEDKYMNIMRAVYNKNIGLYPEGEAQVKKALDCYSNDGMRWDIHSPSLNMVAEEARFRCSNNGKPHIGLNLPVGGLFVGGPTYPREIKEPNGEAKAQVEDALQDKPRCWNCTKAPAALAMCKKCKKARYCNTACQKQDWKKLHKHICGVPLTKIQEDEYQKEADQMGFVSGAAVKAMYESGGRPIPAYLKGGRSASLKQCFFIGTRDFEVCLTAIPPLVPGKKCQAQAFCLTRECSY